jgi:3-deoxy-D-manno-octulosonate 8-phosphate phosphatase KdsC-like HAD superfamily phosphatase
VGAGLAKKTLAVNTKIKNIILDLDGCLTNGKQYISPDGAKLHKAVHSRDKMALRRLIAKGYNILVLTSDDWPGARIWFEEIGCEFAVSKEKHELGLHWGISLGVGDDLADGLWLERCALAYCPADADPRLKYSGKIDVLKTKGGEGIVCEVEVMLDSYELQNTGYVVHSRACY